MNYIVLELKTDTNGVTSVLYDVYGDRAQAESKYHTILAYAALSNFSEHSAAILTQDGQAYMAQSYKKNIEPEAQTEGN